MANGSEHERNRLLTRREVLKAMGLGATALALSGCSVTLESPATVTSQGKDPALGRKTILELYSVFGGTVRTGVIELARKYEQIQSEVGIKITYAPSSGGGGSDNPKLFTAIAANSPPDLAFLTPFSTPQWAELGIMTDLTPYIKRDGLTADDFFPTAWHDMNYKGKVWQVQWDADPNFPFFWNKDLFAQAGLDPNTPPKTIAEVDEFSRKINRISKNGNVTRIGMIPWDTYGFSNSMFTWGWAFGGEFYDPAKDEVTPDNDYVVKALEWMVNYAKSVGGPAKVAVSPPGITLPPFSTGNVALAGLVSENYREIRKASPNMHIGSGLLPYQSPGATQPGAGAWIGGWSVFIPTGAKNPDAAWDFIKWMSATNEGTKAQWDTIGYPPAYRKAAVMQEIKTDPLMGPYYDVLVTAQHSRPAMAVGAFYAAQLELLVSDAIYGKLTPLQALQTVKQSTMNELERFKRELGA
ncbi:MAG: ABC transporter substrate-binding protein [Chloroflexi bacterium]|nr:MAG: ABC transporter substrate-binding protein [Chloroflexota bacterium]